MADVLDQLTIAELDGCSRKLGSDVVTAIHQGTVDRWAALAIVAWTLAARTDPTAQLSAFRQMTAAELATTLGMDDSEPEPEPVPSTPEEHQAQIAAEVSADPTAPAPA